MITRLGATASFEQLTLRAPPRRTISATPRGHDQPPVTMLMAWIAFGDQLIPTDLLGLAVAGIGVWLVYGRRSSKPSAAAEASTP